MTRVQFSALVVAGVHAPMLMLQTRPKDLILLEEWVRSKRCGYFAWDWFAVEFQGSNKWP